MCKLTVILGTFNRGNLLPKAIECILRQTYKDFELIIYDNNSTDDTSMVVKKYLEIDNRIKYVKREKNVGCLMNYKLAIDDCKTEYFSTISDDDLMDLTMYEREMDFLLQNPDVSIVGCNVKYLNEGDWIASRTHALLCNPYIIWNKSEYVHQAMTSNEIQFILSGYIARTEDIKKTGIDTSKNEDCSWIEYLNDHDCKVAMLAEPLYYYYRKLNNVASREIFKVFETLDKRLDRRKKDGERRELIQNYEFIFNRVNNTFFDVKCCVYKDRTEMEKMIFYCDKWMKEIKQNDYYECLNSSIFKSENFMERLKISALILKKTLHFNIKTDALIEGGNIWEQLLESKGNIVDTLNEDIRIGVFGTGFNAMMISLYLLTKEKKVKLYFDNNYEDSFEPDFRSRIIKPTKQSLDGVDFIIISNLSEGSYQSIYKQVKDLNDKVEIIWWKNLT